MPDRPCRRFRSTVQRAQAEQTAFVKALLDPPEPSARLRQAYAAYQQELGR